MCRSRQHTSNTNRVRKQKHSLISRLMCDYYTVILLLLLLKRVCVFDNFYRLIANACTDVVLWCFSFIPSFYVLLWLIDCVVLWHVSYTSHLTPALPSVAFEQLITILAALLYLLPTHQELISRASGISNTTTSRIADLSWVCVVYVCERKWECMCIYSSSEHSLSALLQSNIVYSEKVVFS